MKIDLTTKILDIDGTPINSTDAGEITLGLLASQAILNPEKDATAEAKAKDFSLWYEKLKDAKDADLTSEEVSMIKKRIYIVYPTLWAGQADRLLEGKELKLAKK